MAEPYSIYKRSNGIYYVQFPYSPKCQFLDSLTTICTIFSIFGTYIDYMYPEEVQLGHGGVTKVTGRF